MNAKYKNITKKSPAIAIPFWNSRRAMLLALGLIALATILAYSNSFRASFLFDDVPVVRNNPTIRHLGSIGKLLSPPGDGCAVQSRPVTNVSLAINYAISGLNVWSYHALNLLTHIFAAFLLFGIVHRTLLLPQYEAEWSMAATPLAFAIALLWAVHPLLTNAVTYIIQRTEVLAGMFYLLTLYCAIRGAASARSKSWYAAALVAYLLAMGSKESAISAPLIVLLYDRVFLFSSWRETFRRRIGLYLGFVAVVLLLVVNHIVAKGGKTITPTDWNKTFTYALAQCESILLYLRLAFFPHPLILDYGPPGPQTFWQILPYFLVMVAIFAGLIFAWRRQPWISFLGVGFFAILAPSSSVIPILQEVAAEKRMYLPLAAVITGVVIGVFLLGRRWVQQGKITQVTAQKTGLGLVLLTGCILCLVAFERNKTYGTSLEIWKDTFEKRPRHFRACFNVGTFYFDQKEDDKAIQYFQKALELLSEENSLCSNEEIYNFCSSEIYNGMGMAYSHRGDPHMAMECYEKAIHLCPDNTKALCNHANLLLKIGQAEEAIAEFQKCLQLTPNSPVVVNILGMAYANLGREQEAIPYFEKAVELSPNSINAHNALGRILVSQKRYREAETQYRAALKLNPEFPETYNYLAILLSDCPDESVRNGQQAAVLAQQAIRLSNGQEPISFDALASAYAEMGQFPEAIQILQKATDLATRQNKPNLVELYGKKLQLFRSSKPFRLPPPMEKNAIPQSQP
jgi:tetratricopeptide (TPR) repeat protein